MSRSPRLVMLTVPLLTLLAAHTAFAQGPFLAEPVVMAEPEPLVESQSTPDAEPPAGAVSVSPATAALDPTRQDRLLIALARLDQRMSQTERERSRLRLAGPVVLIVTGASLGAFFGVGALAFGTSLDDVKDDIDRGTYHEINDWDLDGDVADDDLRSQRRMTAALSIISLAHFGLAALGTWWLTKRLHARGRLDRELGGLEFERNSLRLKLDVSATANGASTQLIASF